MGRSAQLYAWNCNIQLALWRQLVIKITGNLVQNGDNYAQHN